MPKMIEISAAEYDRLQDCIREDGMRIAALIEENKALHQDARRLTAAEYQEAAMRYEAEIARMKRMAEEDILLAALSGYPCDSCINNTMDVRCGCDCADCELHCTCHECHDSESYVWRGGK